MKIKITSLGCRLNQSEIESISTRLQEMGHMIVEDDQADIFIINSCAVTLRSERKTRQLIYRAMDITGANCPERIIVTGCSTDEIREDDNITYVSNDHKYLIPDIIKKKMKPEYFQKLETSRFDFATPVKSSTERANLKIQDGCDNYCSYCIIPYMRGEPKSKSGDVIENEFKELLENGYREIILTGVNIGKYADQGQSLPFLVERLLRLPGQFRLHLTSLDPDSTSEHLLQLFTDSKMVKHLHLSLQSGSNSVLKRMNRPYDREKYLTTTERLKSLVPDFNFTTDIIVGFPGETDTEFQDTIDIAKEVGFSHIHTFRYSPRPGTKAAEMDNIIPEIIKTERSRRIVELDHKQKLQFYSRFNNRESILLSEKNSNGVTTGFNEYYIPVETDVILKKNRFYRIKTTLNKDKFKLSGTVISELS